MQVVRDALTLGHNGQLARVLAARREHECYRSVGGEIAHQVEVTVVEWWLIRAARDGDHAGDCHRGSAAASKSRCVAQHR